MPVRIRLARPPGSTKLTTHYHIIAIDSRKRRDAKPIEILGIYDPKLRSRWDKSKPWNVQDAVNHEVDVRPAPDRRVEWSVNRLKYWVSVGAEPTKTIVKLLDTAGLVKDEDSVFHRLHRKLPKLERAPTLADHPFPTNRPSPAPTELS